MKQRFEPLRSNCDNFGKELSERHALWCYIHSMFSHITLRILIRWWESASSSKQSLMVYIVEQNHLYISFHFIYFIFFFSPRTRTRSITNRDVLISCLAEQHRWLVRVCARRVIFILIFSNIYESASFEFSVLQGVTRQKMIIFAGLNSFG